MEPSLCLTSSCTATRQRSTSIATCGTACWTGNKERPPWRWLPGARCRAGTLTVRRRRSTGSQLWSCQRYGQGARLAVFNGTTSVSRRGLVFTGGIEHQRNVSRIQSLNHRHIWRYFKTFWLVRSRACDFLFSDSSFFTRLALYK